METKQTSLFDLPTVHEPWIFPTSQPKAAPAPAANKKLAQKLYDLAEAMQSGIEDKLRPRLDNTRRRAAMAASAVREGESMQRTQMLLYALSKGHEDGGIHPLLSKISNRKIASWLVARAFLYNVDIRHAEAYGFERWAIWTDEHLGRIFDAENSSYPNYADERSFLKTVGITSLDQLREALLAIKPLIGEPTPQELKAKDIKALEERARFARIPGYFPSTISVISRMLPLSRIRPGDRVLEPSAGNGRIIEATLAAEPGAIIDCFEINPSLQQILKLKGFNLIGSDFMDVEPNPIYDAVLMNPPFENGQDIEHIRRAYDWLKPDGRLVSIASNSVTFRKDKKYQTFRDWADDINAYTQDLPPDSFMDSEVQTGVSTVMLSLTK